MGNLTDDLTRLRAEITTLRDNRSALRTALTRNILQLKGNVEDLRSGFRQAHAEMANAGHKTRVQFVTNLSQQVAGLLGAVAADLKGAREAWAGEIRMGRSVVDVRHGRATSTIREEPEAIETATSDAQDKGPAQTLETQSASVSEREAQEREPVERESVVQRELPPKKPKHSPGRSGKKR